MDATHPSSVFAPSDAVERVTLTETHERFPSVEREPPKVQPQPRTEHFGFICPNCGCRGHGTLSTTG